MFDQEFHVSPDILIIPDICPLQVTDQLKAVNDVATSTNTDLKHSPILSSSALEDTDEDELTSSVADLSLFPGIILYTKFAAVKTK